MNLRYRQSEPHPDSDAAHLGSSPHSCVGIMRRRVPHEHVAEGSAVGDGNADADGIAIRVNHRCQVAGGVLPVCHSLFGNPFEVRDGEHRQVGTETVGVPGRCHSLTFRSVIMVSVQVGGAYPSFPPQRGENSLISLLLLFPLNPLGPGHLLLAYANSPCRWASVGTLTLSSVNSRTPAQIRPNSFGRCLFPQRLEKPHTAAPVAKHGLVFAVSPLPFDAL